MIDRIPITLLSGFLGSGKTTLLNRVLATPEAGQFAVIVNEFGEIGIDQALIQASADNMVLLDSGCVCCTVRDSLAETLDELYEKRRRGSIPPYERVLIETTGLADPGPVLRVLATDALVAGTHQVQTLAVTVDAFNGWSTLSHHPESVKQAALADLLILTKTDLADRADTSRLRARLREINPVAAVHDSANDDLISLLLADRHILLGTEQARGWRDPADRPASVCREAEDSSHPHDHAHDHLDGIVTLSARTQEAISSARLAELLRELGTLKGDDLLRVKGLVAVESQPNPIVIHGVQQLIHAPSILPAWPDEQRTRIVFIAREAIRAPLERLIESFFGSTARGASGGVDS